MKPPMSGKIGMYSAARVNPSLSMPTGRIVKKARVLRIALRIRNQTIWLRRVADEYMFDEHPAISPPIASFTIGPSLLRIPGFS